MALVRTLLTMCSATLRATPEVDHIALVSAERDCVADDVPLLLDQGEDLNARSANPASPAPSPRAPPPC